MTRSPWRFLGLLAVAFCLSNCLVVNIQVTFPEKAVESAAENIESQVRDGVLDEAGAAKGTSFAPSHFPWRIAISFGMPSASAAEPAIDFAQTNPVIRKIVETRTERFRGINTYLTSGYIGEATDGYLLELKDVKVPLAELAQLRKQLKAENDDRKRLFEEISKINKITGKDVIKVQTVWAQTNRKKLLADQFYMDKDGKWLKKTKAEYEKDKKELDEKEKTSPK
jgi:uncharacterized protein YdbL (DUF1318 family)